MISALSGIQAPHEEQLGRGRFSVHGISLPFTFNGLLVTLLQRRLLLKIRVFVLLPLLLELSHTALP